MKIFKPRISVQGGKPSEDFFGLAPPDCIRLLFNAFLDREPEKEALEAFAKAAASGAGIRWISETILNSDEFQEKYIRRLSDRFGMNLKERIEILIEKNKFPHVLHEARKKMVQSLIPEARCILDLGGADSSDPKGALLVLGYPFAPEKIDIVDLPPKERIFPVKDFDGGATEFVFGEIKIKYHYHSMTDLEHFPSNFYDLVWSGEAVEHIGKDELNAVLPEISRVLKPGGWFCFDTPNRDITRLQIGDEGFINIEHKHEYQCNEISQMLESAGFVIENKQGLFAMPHSLESGEFITDEFYSAEDDPINISPEKSYLMFFRTKKPE